MGEGIFGTHFEAELAGKGERSFFLNWKNFDMVCALIDAMNAVVLSISPSEFSFSQPFSRMEV